MKGFFNRLLRVDLSNRQFRYEDLPDAVLAWGLGGKGLGVHLLMTENPVGVDPLSPENTFIFAGGPVTGTKMWSQSRFAVFSKSPATGGFAESYCGDTLAPKLKGCGVDAVVMTGRSDSSCYLVLDENGVEFRDAAALRGQEARPYRNLP